MANALPDTIEIRFKSTGTPEVLGALKALNKETRELISAQKGMVVEGTKKIGVDKAALNSLRKLNLSLKTQGHTLKQVGIQTKLYKQALKGNRVALDQIRLATKKYTAELHRASSGFFGATTNGRLLRNTFATLRSKMLLVSFAVLLINRSILTLVKSFAAQEAANARLAAGLANVQDTTAGVTQRLIDYSAALQKTTAFGDELITTGMVQFTTFGLNEKAIKVLTPQVLNVARAIQSVSGTMPELNSLFIAFGKSTSTAVSALTRYGVVLTDTEKVQLESMGANERAVEIAKILDKQYGGLAEAYAKTTAGMLESASAARGDAAEAFGEVLAPAVVAVSNAMKVAFEAMSPERIKRFGVAIGAAGLAALYFSGTLMKAVKAIRAFNIAQIKTGWGVITAGIGLATYAALEYFDVFNDNDDVLLDYEKRLQAAKIPLDDLAQAQAESVDTLRLRLAILSASSEQEKMLLQLGHDASLSEKILIDLIVKKMEAIKDAADVQKETAQRRKEDLKALNEDQKRLEDEERSRQKAVTQFLRDQDTARREVFKDNLDFQLMLINQRAEAFIQLGLQEVDVTRWSEQQKTDIIIAHLEKRSALYNSFMAGYDGFVNALTDMDLSGKQRREKIWEATRVGFIQFLAGMLKDKIKQMIAEAIVDKISKATQIAAVAVQAKAMSALWAAPAFGATLATGGTNVPTALAAMAAGRVASTAIFAEKGFEGFVDKPTVFVTGEGNKREHVSITPTESPSAVPSGGGDTMQIIIQGGIVDEDYLVNTFMPAFNKAKALA